MTDKEFREYTDEVEKKTKKQDREGWVLFFVGFGVMILYAAAALLGVV